MKFKKLIPALCMLLVAAVLMGTSTFAWFSMNTSVTATDMQVVVKSDNTWLLISGTETTASGIQTQNDTSDSLEVLDADAKVYPSSPALDDDEVAYLTTATGKVVGTNAAITTAGVKVVDYAKASAVTNWYTANALTPDAATIDTATARQLSAFTNYVIVRDAYLTVAEGANDAHNLVVTATIADKDDSDSADDISGVKVLVAVEDDGVMAVLDSTNNTANLYSASANTAITDTTVKHVRIYIYYDGDETAVHTNNAADLAGAEITLAFDVDSVPAA